MSLTSLALAAVLSLAASLVLLTGDGCLPAGQIHPNTGLLVIPDRWVLQNPFRGLRSCGSQMWEIKCRLSFPQPLVSSTPGPQPLPFLPELLVLQSVLWDKVLTR